MSDLAIYRVQADGQASHLVTGRDAAEKLALDLVQDPAVSVVSCEKVGEQPNPYEQPRSFTEVMRSSEVMGIGDRPEDKADLVLACDASLDEYSLLHLFIDPAENDCSMGIPRFYVPMSPETAHRLVEMSTDPDDLGWSLQPMLRLAGRCSR